MAKPARSCRETMTGDGDWYSDFFRPLADRGILPIPEELVRLLPAFGQ